MSMKNVYYGWWVVGGGFTLLFFATGTYFYSFPIFYEAILADMQWSRAETAAALSISAFVMGLTAPFVAVIIQRMGVRKVMISSSILSGIAFVLLYTVSVPWQLYLYFGVILPVGMAGIQVVSIITVIERWFVKKRGTAIGIVTTGIGAGGAVLAPTAGVLISRFGWQTTYLFWALLITVAGVIISSTVMRFPKQGELRSSETRVSSLAAELPMDGATLSMALKSKAFWLVSFAVMGWAWAQSAGVIHQVAYAVDIGIDRVAAAGAVGSLTASSILGRLLFGRLGDIIEKRYVFMMAISLQVAAFVVLLMAKNLTMIYVYSILLGITTGAILPTVAGLVADHFGRKYFGVIYGASFFWLSCGNVIGPMYAGWIFDTTGSYQLAFIGSAVLSALAIVLIYLSGGKPAYRVR
ncbi:MFS transporter [Chloroflexota bacterium]